MFAFKVEVRTKKCPCPFIKSEQNRSTENQLLQLISCSKCCPLARTHALSLGRHWSMALSMRLCLNSAKNSYFKFLQGIVATLFRWSWKILSYFVANLSKTLPINFYQNRSTIVEVMIKKYGVFFMPHSVLTCFVYHCFFLLYILSYNMVACSVILYKYICCPMQAIWFVIEMI